MKVGVGYWSADCVFPIAEKLKKAGYEVIERPRRDEKMDIYLSSFFGFHFSDESTLPRTEDKKVVFHSHDLDYGPIKESGLRGFLTHRMKKHIDFAARYGEERCRLVGWAKSDLLFSPERDKIAKSLREKLHLPHEKTVLYAGTVPFWLDNGNSNHPYSLIDILPQFEDLDVNLIIKGHESWDHPFHQHRTDYKDRLRVRREMMEKAEGMPNVRWIDSRHPLYPLFLISDICLTYKASCVYKEFMLKGPVLDIIDGYAMPHKPVKLPEWYDGLKVHSDKVVPRIKRALANPEEFSEIRKRMVDYYFYKPDGHVCDRAVEAIKEWFPLS